MTYRLHNNTDSVWLPYSLFILAFVSEEAHLIIRRNLRNLILEIDTSKTSHIPALGLSQISFFSHPGTISKNTLRRYEVILGRSFLAFLHFFVVFLWLKKTPQKRHAFFSIFMRFCSSIFFCCFFSPNKSCDP